jgi:hypothetical protein
LSGIAVGIPPEEDVKFADGAEVAPLNKILVRDWLSAY